MKKRILKITAVLLILCMLPVMLSFPAFAADRQARTGMAGTQGKGPVIDKLEKALAALIIYTLIEAFAQAIKDGATDWYAPDADTYDLQNALDFVGFSYLVNTGVTFEGKTVNLKNNINLFNLPFFPIGSNATDSSFKGTFDGHGNTVRGVSFVWASDILEKSGIDLSQISLTWGLFGDVKNASIKNVTVSAADLEGPMNVDTVSAGTIAGQAANTRFENCFVSYSRIDFYVRSSLYLGGITGYCYDSSFTGCQTLDAYTTVSFEGKTPVYYGGIAGLCVDSSIKECIARGEIGAYTSGEAYYAGVATVRNGTVSSCFARSSFIPYNSGAEFSPLCFGENLSAADNYIYDDVYTDPYASSATKEQLESGWLSYRYNTASETQANRKLWSYDALALRFADQEHPATCKVTYMARSIVYKTGYTNPDGTADDIACTLDHFQGWFSDPDCKTYFDFNETFTDDVTVYADINDGAPPKDENGVYQVETAQQFLIAAGYAAYYDVPIRLVSDLDFTGLEAQGASFIPYFRGTIDGSGHKIMGIRIDGGEIGKAGLVGRFTGEVKNIVFEDCIIKTTGDFCGLFATTEQDSSFTGCTVTACEISGGDYTGTLTGGITEGTLNVTDCTIDSVHVTGFHRTGGIAGGCLQNGAAAAFNGCSFSGEIIGYGNAVGGITGFLPSGSLTNCKTLPESSLTVSCADPPVSYTGGIVGIADNITAENCSNQLEVSASSCAGGLFGSIANSTIGTCSNNGKISGKQDYAGGISAAAQNATLYYCVNTATVAASKYTAGGILASASDVQVIACANKAAVSCGKQYAGGIAGNIQGGSIRSCYNTGEINAAQYAGGIAGICRDTEINTGYSTGKINASEFCGALCGYGGGQLSRFAALAGSAAVCSGFGPVKNTVFFTKTEMQSQKLIDFLNASDDFFIDDTANANGGYPLLSFESQRNILLRGDANGDGTVNVGDVILIQKHLAALEIIDNKNLCNVMLNSGGINISSVIQIQKFLAGMIEKI